MDDSATPTRVVEPQEIFFSLTDRRGVITGSNRVFQEIAHFDRNELMGAPHSLIRNPDVPGGVFRLMWDVIQAGRPFAGYVLNKAHDGANYWVYATVTPMPDGGYLSVRTAPCLTDVWVTAAALYESVLTKENELRASGLNRRKAAEVSRDLVLEGLAGIGFASYEDFMLATLPAEVMERAERAARTSTPPVLVDPELEELRSLARAIGDEASNLLTQLERFQALGASLREASGEASIAAEELTAATAAARQASELVAEEAPAVLSTAQAMEDGGRRTLTALTELGIDLDRDARLLRGLQIRIAIARLHADMVISFVEEAAWADDPAECLVNLPEVTVAVQTTVNVLADALGAHTAAMRDAVSKIDSISSGLSDFQSFLFMWRTLLIRHGVSGSVSQHLAPIDHQLSAGSTQITHLRALAEKCLGGTRPYDAGPITARVRRLAEIGGRARASAVHSNGAFEH